MKGTSAGPILTEARVTLKRVNAKGLAEKSEASHHGNGKSASYPAF